MVWTCGLHAKLWLLIINVNVLLWYNTFIQPLSLWSQMLNSVSVNKGNLVKTNTKKCNGSVHVFLTQSYRVGVVDLGWLFSMQHYKISLGSSFIFSSRVWPIVMLGRQKRVRQIIQKAVWNCQFCSHFFRDNSTIRQYFTQNTGKWRQYNEEPGISILRTKGQMNVMDSNIAKSTSFLSPSLLS